VEFWCGNFGIYDVRAKLAGSGGAVYRGKWYIGKKFQNSTFRENAALDKYSACLGI